MLPIFCIEYWVPRIQTLVIRIIRHGNIHEQKLSIGSPTAHVHTIFFKKKVFLIYLNICNTTTTIYDAGCSYTNCKDKYNITVDGNTISSTHNNHSPTTNCNNKTNHLRLKLMLHISRLPLQRNRRKTFEFPKSRMDLWGL